MLQTLGIAEAATFLRVHRTTVLALASSGTIPAAKVGREWVFMESDLDDYLRAKVNEQTMARRKERISTPRRGRPRNTPPSLQFA